MPGTITPAGAAVVQRRHSRCFDLVVQALPPVHDAIGEYTSCLATYLAQKVDVRILTQSESSSDALTGVAIEPCFQLSGKGRFDNLWKRLNETSAQAVVLQYNPFGWGRRGWAPDLIQTMRRFKRNRQDIQLGVMFHETYTMSSGWRSWVMRQYQRRQYRQLVSLADICFFSTEAWAREEQRRRPTAKIVHAPVGSNLPLSCADRQVTRQRWEIPSDSFVCGVFGGAHPSRLIPWIKDAVNRIAQKSTVKSPPTLLHVGGEKIDWSGVQERVVTPGRLDPADAADAIAAMDLLINPLTDGISTRRGSAMAALQHGIPVLTTRGIFTDSIWATFEGKGVFLASSSDPKTWNAAIDLALRCIRDNPAEIRAHTADLYQSLFSWPVLVDLFTSHLGTLDATEALGK